MIPLAAIGVYVTGHSACCVQSMLTTVQGMPFPIHKRLICLDSCPRITSVPLLSKDRHPDVVACTRSVNGKKRRVGPLGVTPPPPDPELVTIQPEASTSGCDSADFVWEVGSEQLRPDDGMPAFQHSGQCTHLVARSQIVWVKVLSCTPSCPVVSQEAAGQTGCISVQSCLRHPLYAYGQHLPSC